MSFQKAEEFPLEQAVIYTQGGPGFEHLGAKIDYFVNRYIHTVNICIYMHGIALLEAIANCFNSKVFPVLSFRF